MPPLSTVVFEIHLIQMPSLSMTTFDLSKFKPLSMGNEVIEFDMMGIADDAVDIEHPVDEEDLLDSSPATVVAASVGEVYIPEGDTNLEP